MKPPADPHRGAMLAKLHIARKQLAMEEGSYRALLARVAGVESAALCDAAGLARVLAEFERLGFSAARPARRDRKPHVRKIWAIWGDLKPLLDQADDDALRGFVRRQTRSAKNPEGVSAPEWLDGIEAAKVIEGLKGWLARVRAAKMKEGVPDV